MEMPCEVGLSNVFLQMGDYLNHLFSYVPPERLNTFSYGHVIPEGNLTVQPILKGILNSEFDFTFEKRGALKMVSYHPDQRIDANTHCQTRGLILAGLSRPFAVQFPTVLLHSFLVMTI